MAMRSEYARHGGGFVENIALVCERSRGNVLVKDRDAHGAVQYHRHLREGTVSACVTTPSQFAATSDGRVAFSLRHPRADGATHVVFPELAVMHKLAALVPPPGRHAVKYFGVLSSASPLRSEVVPPRPFELGPSSVMMSPGGFPMGVSSELSRRASWAQLLRRVYGIDA